MIMKLRMSVDKLFIHIGIFECLMKLMLSDVTFLLLINRTFDILKHKSF